MSSPWTLCVHHGHYARVCLQASIPEHYLVMFPCSIVPVFCYGFALLSWGQGNCGASAQLLCMHVFSGVCPICSRNRTHVPRYAVRSAQGGVVHCSCVSLACSPLLLCMCRFCKQLKKQQNDGGSNPKSCHRARYTVYVLYDHMVFPSWNRALLRLT